MLGTADMRQKGGGSEMWGHWVLMTLDKRVVGVKCRGTGYCRHGTKGWRE